MDGQENMNGCQSVCELTTESDVWDFEKAFEKSKEYPDDDACGRYFHIKNVQAYEKKVRKYVENHVEKYTDEEAVRALLRCLYSMFRASQKRKRAIRLLLLLNHKCNPSLTNTVIFAIIDDFEERKSKYRYMRQGFCYFLPKIIEVCKIDDPESEGFGINYGRNQRRIKRDVINEREKNRIKELIQNPDMTLEGMVEILNAEGFKIGKSTLKNRLSEMGISWRAKKKALRKRDEKI